MNEWMNKKIRSWKYKVYVHVYIILLIMCLLFLTSVEM